MTDQPRLPELDDDQALAVAAVVDGTADADQRALVDASPDLQAWVRAEIEVQTELGSVVVDPSQREAGIGAALAAFDELHDSGAPSSDTGTGVAAVVVPLESRRSRWNPRSVLAAAAAVVAVLAIGGVVANLGNGDTDDDSTAIFSSAATASPSEKESGGDSSGGAPAPLAASQPTIGALNGPADPITAAAPADQAAADSASANPEIESATEAPADTEAAEETAATEPSSTPPSAFSTPISVADPAALIDFVIRAEAARNAGSETSPGASATTVLAAAACLSDDLVPLGQVVYGTDGVQAIVVRVVDTDEARALAVDDCSVLVSVRT